MRSHRPLEYPLDRCVTGPHLVRGEDGSCLVYRCELCGTESRDPALRRGCYRCDGRIGWR